MFFGGLGLFTRRVQRLVVVHGELFEAEMVPEFRVGECFSGLWVDSDWAVTFL